MFAEKHGNPRESSPLWESSSPAPLSIQLHPGRKAKLNFWVLAPKVISIFNPPPGILPGKVHSMNFSCFHFTRFSVIYHAICIIFCVLIVLTNVDDDTIWVSLRGDRLHDAFMPSVFDSLKCFTITFLGLYDSSLLVLILLLLLLIEFFLTSYLLLLLLLLTLMEFFKVWKAFVSAFQ